MVMLTIFFSFAWHGSAMFFCECTNFGWVVCSFDDIWGWKKRLTEAGIMKQKMRGAITPTGTEFLHVCLSNSSTHQTFFWLSIADRVLEGCRGLRSRCLDILSSTIHNLPLHLTLLHLYTAGRKRGLMTGVSQISPNCRFDIIRPDCSFDRGGVF